MILHLFNATSVWQSICNFHLQKKQFKIEIKYSDSKLVLICANLHNYLNKSKLNGISSL